MVCVNFVPNYYSLYIAHKECYHPTWHDTWLKISYQYFQCVPARMRFHCEDGWYWLQVDPVRCLSHVRVYWTSTVPPFWSEHLIVFVPWVRYFTHDPRWSSKNTSSSQTSIIRGELVATFLKKSQPKLNQSEIKWCMLCPFKVMFHFITIII